MYLIGVVAMSLDSCIAKNGQLPWHYKEDFSYFKKLTLDSTIILGRKTWDSLPTKPLPRRNNVVITRTLQQEHFFPNTYFTTLENLDNVIRPLKEPHFLIGGSIVFKELWNYIKEFHVTHIQETVENGDIFFPKERLYEDFKEFNTIKLSDKCIMKHYLRF